MRLPERAASVSAMSTGYIWLTIVVLTVVVGILRNFFLFVPRRLQPRGGLERALRYAPIAALAALVFPEVLRDLRTMGFEHWALFGDARLLAALALALVVKLTRNLFAGLATGVAVFLLVQVMA